MGYPPGQGKSGRYLMELWRRYLEQYAEYEGSPEEQIAVGSYHAAEVFGFLSMELDREGKYRELIDHRTALFSEAIPGAELFGDQLLNATFTIYNHANTLCHQFSSGIAAAEKLIGEIDARLKMTVHQAEQIERSAAAMRAVFPLICLMTMILNRTGEATSAIRAIEERFANVSSRAPTGWESLVNALYRVVEMTQVLVCLSDSVLRDHVEEIAARFQEEDQTKDVLLKLRNGFCRLFELSHLLANHLDEVLP